MTRDSVLSAPALGRFSVACFEVLFENIGIIFFDADILFFDSRFSTSAFNL